MDEEQPSANLVRRLANGLETERVEAAKELARRKDSSVLADVCAVLRGAESERAREMAAWLLGESCPGTDATLEALHATIADSNASASLRGQAMESLGNQVSHLTGGEAYERAADVLIPLLQHPSVEIVYNAVFALGAMRCRRARFGLERIARDDHRQYKGLETIGQAALFSIGCIDWEPHGK